LIEIIFLSLILYHVYDRLIIFTNIDETEKLRAELAVVRKELEPWEKQLIEHKGKLDVAMGEKKLLEDKVYNFMYIKNHFK
jgi:hypothetical protein